MKTFGHQPSRSVALATALTTPLTVALLVAVLAVVAVVGAGPAQADAAAPSTAAARAVSAGTLTVSRLGGGAVAIDAVQVSAGAIGVPADANRLGWWRGSVPFKAPRGSSIIVGHVTDESDAPGAFYNLDQLRRGDRIIWTVGKTKKVFKVVTKTYTPRSGSLPDRIWQKGGPRMVHLVSCARRVVYDDGGYHYTHNVTVSARLVTRPAGSLS